MPFIRGAFRLVGKNKKGGSYGFEPDGDSYRIMTLLTTNAAYMQPIEHDLLSETLGTYPISTSRGLQPLDQTRLKEWRSAFPLGTLHRTEPGVAPRG